jgi:hypothetical protein
VPIGNIIVQNEFDRQLCGVLRKYIKKNISVSAGQYYDDFIMYIDKSKKEE